MAKKLPWGSNFSIEDLVIDHEDDIYASFPFLELEEMLMSKVNEFRIGDNTVRGTKDTVSQKIVGLTGSLFYGWDRTSWPIPFMPIGGWKEAFDRRHTLKVCRDNNAIESVPSAKYKRVFPSNGGIFNSFTDHSILTMAAMWGNVFGPIVEDTKDYMFETAGVNILKDEKERAEEDLLTRPFVRELLRHMGCYERYNNNKSVVERIVTKILDSLRDPEKVVGKLTINNDEADVDKFLADHDEWQQHNSMNDNYIFMKYLIQDNDSQAYTYAERLLTMVCKNEEEHPEKITKVLLYNKDCSNNAKKIVAAREKFRKRLNSGWVARRDNALAPFSQVFREDIIDNYRKRLSDLKLEIWVYNQIEDEDEPFEMAFDTEN